MGYFLGMDGGGSKTTALLCDAAGNVVAQAAAGSLNYRAVGYETARASLAGITAQIKHPVCAAFIGNAALAGAAPPEELHALCDGILHAEHIAMDSDLHIALEALRGTGPCAVVIAGTGSMAAGRAGAGEPVLHTGGWGWLLGDEGSGFHIGWEALRAALRGHEGSGPATALTRAMCGHYGAAQPEDLLDIFYNPLMKHNEIAAFAKAVIACDDEVARAVLRRCAGELAETAKALLRKLPGETRVGLWGGVFEHCEFYRAAFIEALGVPADLLPVPPVMGAVYAAIKLAKGE